MARSFRRFSAGRSHRAALGVGLVAVTAGAVAVTLAVTSGAPTPGSDAGSDDPVDLGPVSQVAALKPFQGCDALLGYYRRHAAELVGPYGLPGSGFGDRAALSRSAAESSGDMASSAPAKEGTTSSTGTNVQVAGVDEADVAKLSGDVLYTVAAGRLQLARVEGRRVTRLGRLDLPAPDASEKTVGWAPNQLLVDGDTVLLLGQIYVASPAAAGSPEPGIAGGAVADIRMPGLMRTRIAEVDTSDPARPRLLRTLDADGGLVGARLVDGVARLAVTSTPTITWRYPAGSENGVVGRQAERRAQAANRAVAAGSTLDDWLPSYTLTDYDGAGVSGTPEQGRLVDCPAVAAPATFSGLDTLSLLALDLREGGLAHRSSAVVASGSTLYATADSTYVATSPWQDWTAMSAADSRTAARRQRTAVHQFTNTGRTESRYVASGSVPGFLLGQFALDEYDGALRVASTLDLPGAGGVEPGSPQEATQPRQAASESRVTVLERRGSRLATVGSVGGLGRNETIRAVRFLGPVGYVVTFRQTDPLYTIDLEEPAEPRVAGELKILGYSAYLHPAGEGRLLGVGQDADKRGTVRGLQLSLFDVSDPSAPRRLDAVGLDGAWSDSEGDHHAFTMANGLALTPYSAMQQPVAAEPLDGSMWHDSGILAVRVRADRLEAPKRLRPLSDGPVRYDPSSPTAEPAMAATPLRTFVVDDTIYTVTTTGIAVHDAGSLKRLGFTELESFSR